MFFPGLFVAKQHEPGVLYSILVIEFSLQALTIQISDIHLDACLLTSTKSIFKFRILLWDGLLITAVNEWKGLPVILWWKLSFPFLPYDLIFVWLRNMFWESFKITLLTGQNSKKNKKKKTALSTSMKSKKWKIFISFCFHHWRTCH